MRTMRARYAPPRNLRKSKKHWHIDNWQSAFGSKGQKPSRVQICTICICTPHRMMTPPTPRAVCRCPMQGPHQEALTSQAKLLPFLLSMSFLRWIKTQIPKTVSGGQSCAASTTLALATRVTRARLHMDGVNLGE